MFLYGIRSRLFQCFLSVLSKSSHRIHTIYDTTYDHKTDSEATPLNNRAETED